MFNFDRKLFRNARNIRLEKEKKESIKEAVLLFVKKNPCPPAGRWLPAFKPAYISILALVLILAIGGGVSAQAQLALPGDPLYPVKIGFNEKVLQILTFSDTAKVNLNIRLAELRLKEAEKLMAKGKITPEMQAKINNNFNAKTEAISKIIEKLNNAKMYKAAEKASSALEASLKAHPGVLEKIQEKKIKNILKIKSEK